MPQLVWSAVGNTVFTHMQNIGSHEEFSSILVRFKSDIRGVKWSTKYHAWEVPLANFPQMVRFADSYGLEIVWVGHIGLPKQLRLL